MTENYSTENSFKITADDGSAIVNRLCTILCDQIEKDREEMLPQKSLALLCYMAIKIKPDAFAYLLTVILRVITEMMDEHNTLMGAPTNWAVPFQESSKEYFTSAKTSSFIDRFLRGELDMEALHDLSREISE